MDDTNLSRPSPEPAGRPPGSASVTVDFEAAYVGTPPWDIGAPQPALVELADAGALQGDVLDAGCGTGEHALLASARGLRATGIDSSHAAVARARAKARHRGLPTRFLVADALDLGSLGEQFGTVLDSGLFHVFDDDQRTRYVHSLRAAVRPGGRVFLLCFSDRLPDNFGPLPRRVSEAEIHDSFGTGWQVDAIDEARMTVTFAPDGVFARRASITRV